MSIPPLTSICHSHADMCSHELASEPTLRRLPWYLAYVSQLRSKGVDFVSSTNISRAINVDASQIVKDLSVLNVKGKTRIGYEVATLDDALRDYLGFEALHNAVIVGVGSLGKALITDTGLARFGLNIVAGFDVDASVVDTQVHGVPVYHSDTLAQRLPSLEAEIGIVTVPAEYAQQVADMMVEAGIKALWNFTPWRIHTAAGVVVQNTSIYAHLAVMYNRLNANQ